MKGVINNGVKKVYSSDHCATCFFRSTVEKPAKKVLLQITERCNFNCSHCFVSSTKAGGELLTNQIEKLILPTLLEDNVTKVTITGGEPFVHKDILKITKLLLSNGIGVSLCTNASLVTASFLNEIKTYRNVHFNVSLDGFSKYSHSLFRGINEDAYNGIIKNIDMIAQYGLLNGILVTPNHYSTICEYVNLCGYAKNIGANYVLFNPLSPFGRGADSKSLAFTESEMIDLRNQTQNFTNEIFEVIYIRFPNNIKLPLSECLLGEMPYIFVDGRIAICPYLEFASHSTLSMFTPEQFIIGNILDSDNLTSSLKRYELPEPPYFIEKELKCLSNCGGGCLAAKVASGFSLTHCETEMCPVKEIQS